MYVASFPGRYTLGGNDRWKNVGEDRMPVLSPHALAIDLAVFAVLVTVLGALAWLLGARLRGQRVLVRCSWGHQFTTKWIPFGSFNAIRLGMVRFQYCPVGEHWAFITPVRGGGRA